MSVSEDDRFAEARRSLRIADEDVRVAKASLSLEEPALGAAAYHCQQAAEKLMKGLLILAGQSFRKTHDLDELAEAAQAHYPSLGIHLDACRRFTHWGLAGRYPAVEDDAVALPTSEEVATAARQIEAFAVAIASLRR